MKNDKGLRELFNFSYCLDNILQRAYEWTVVRLLKFINDILGNNLRNNTGGHIRYNIGDFITYPDKDNINLKWIFDGQQRITTLMLLIANIYHHSNDVFTSIKQFLYVQNEDYTDLTATVGKARLLLKDDDNIIFQKILKNGTNGLSKEEKKIPLARNYDAISENFTNGKNNDELTEMFNTIMKNTSFFERECETREEGIKQFNNLNYGGQTLTRARTVISLIYGQWRNIGTEDMEVEEFLCKVSNMSNNDIKNILASFLFYCGEKYSEAGFTTSTDNLMTTHSNMAKELMIFYKNYYTIMINEKFNDDENIHCNPFINQSNMRQVWINLFTDKLENIVLIPFEERYKAYKYFEWGCISNSFLNHAQGASAIFDNIVEGFNNEEGSLSDYVKKILIQRKLFMNLEELHKPFETRNDLPTNILRRIENEYISEINLKEQIEHIDKVSLEHIHSQTPRANGDNCSDDCAYRFGNMTLIGLGLNKSLQNKPYTEKIMEYNKSPYYITRRIADSYNDWNNDSVLKNEEFYLSILKAFYSF